MKVVSGRWSAISAFSVALCAAPFALGASAKAQSAKIHRVGFLLVGGASDSPRTRAFREGLHQLGYVEGKNIAIERRAANGKIELLDELAAEIVRLKVDVFVVSGNVVVRAAKKATSTIPIVTTLVSDPVENGFIASLARPGGNVTGLTSLGSELSGKRLELLKEIVPRLSNVVVLGNSSTPGNPQAMKQTEAIAKAFHLQLTYKNIENLTDIEAVFKTASKNRGDAFFMLPNAVLLLHRKRVVDLAAINRLPMMYDASDYVQIGGLSSYAADAVDLFKRSAIYVDKILKGAKPADLPVEQPTKFEFVINLKAAKQIGLIIPPNVLARASKVIR